VTDATGTGTGGPTAPERRTERRIGAALVVSTLAALALAGVYVSGGQPQAEGALLMVSLGALGVAVILWARLVVPGPEVTEERGTLDSPDEDEEAVEENLDETLAETPEVGRRSVLRLFWAALGALGLAALFPIRSLGPSPGRTLLTTAWREGRRLVDQEGRLVRPDTLVTGGTLTVFPEGAERAGDAQAVLVRVEPALLRLSPGREGWTPAGNIAYSKICTHVGCPVGLYQQDTHELVCPCHQSTFDVLNEARPSFGPATRPLPQLPLAVDGEGFLVARGDFDGPVGPGFWNLG
jgi:ubiquinol-cytochrome c reductase iron-sulfur subunit